jgi:hypothetical protein
VDKFMCHGKKERRRIIIIRNGAKTISLQTLFGRLNKHKLCNYITRQISGTTGQNFMKLGGVIDICF